MSYTTLYRKFRPSGFDGVKGQDHIVTSLINQINADRIGHAYLFCGTRGTGKTSVAKIFARAVNCESPVNGSPCGECETCKAINEGRAMNIIEMDAASNNSVEDVRAIRDEIGYAPSIGKYTVYIVDEVHMLSTAAFNALLKTLEEPPAHAIFILATTDPQKVPITILSRCQQYNFKRISIDTIANQLGAVMAAEDIEVEDKALYYVAKVADGSMRDALSLLDQCIAFNLGQKLTYDSVLDVLGAVDTDIFNKLTDNLLNADITSAINTLDEIIIQGREITQFVTDYIWYLRNLMLIKTTSKEVENVIDVSSEQIEIMKEQSEKIGVHVIMRYIRILSELSSSIKFSPQKRVMAEIAIIKMCKPIMESDFSAIENRIEQIENKIESGAIVSSNVQVKEPAQAKPKEEIRYAKAVPKDIQYVVDNFPQVLNKLDQSARVGFKDGIPALGGDDELILLFDEKTLFVDRIQKDESLLQSLVDAIKNELKKEVRVTVKRTTKDNTGDYERIQQLTNTTIEMEDF